MIITIGTRKILTYLMRVRINFEMKEQRSYMVCDLVSDDVNLSRNLKYRVDANERKLESSTSEYYQQFCQTCKIMIYFNAVRPSDYPQIFSKSTEN